MSKFIYRPNPEGIKKRAKQAQHLQRWREEKQLDDSHRTRLAEARAKRASEYVRRPKK